MGCYCSRDSVWFEEGVAYTCAFSRNHLYICVYTYTHNIILASALLTVQHVRIYLELAIR